MQARLDLVSPSEVLEEKEDENGCCLRETAKRKKCIGERRKKKEGSPDFAIQKKKRDFSLEAYHHYFRTPTLMSIFSAGDGREEEEDNIVELIFAAVAMLTSLRRSLPHSSLCLCRCRWILKRGGRERRVALVSLRSNCERGKEKHKWRRL
ncbi:unnamed protein product [Linum trigynum]|uniref:Uncharacterized protein n=1 Tax=Linum trigynum TaxID=586398 RepID=A0AAV2DDG6_9ROSI